MVAKFQTCCATSSPATRSMISLATFCLDNPSSILSKVDLATELWKALMASCVGMSSLPLHPAPLVEDFPTNLVIYLIADFPHLPVTFGLLDH